MGERRMWHLKTRLGTFWLIENVADNAEQADGYYLGIDDHELGVYNSADTAAEDVYAQQTGYLKWDCQSKVKVPKEISAWVEGSPEDWHH